MFLPIKELNVLLEAEDPPDDIPEALKWYGAVTVEFIREWSLTEAVWLMWDIWNASVLKWEMTNCFVNVK